MFFERFFGIVRKEFTELLRDRLYLTFIFVVPLMVMILLGYGLNLDVKNIPITFLDYDRSKLSREYIDSFINSEYFKLYRLVETYEEAERLIRLGEIRALIVIPEDFSQKIYKGQKVEVQVLIDGTYPSRAEVIKGYLSTINFLFNQRFSAFKSPIEVELRAWYNPGLESKNFIMPGMLVTTLCFYPVLLGCLVIVREKELGSIFNFYCSPARSWEIIFAKAFPYTILSFFTYLILFFITVVIFETKFVGNFLVLSLASFFYISCTVGLGLLISTFTKTQITAMLIAFITTVVPSYLYSGFLYPVSSMEMSGQIISKFIPATYFLGVVRGIYLKEASLSFYGKDLLSLVVYTVAVYSLATLRLVKRIS